LEDALCRSFEFRNDLLNSLIFYAIAMVSASLQFYFFAKKDFGRCLKFLIFGNTGIIIVLLHLLYFFLNEISIFPRTYMIFECIVVSILIFLEASVQKALKN
jgi:FtsH-binding integral membrane protein